MSKLFIFDETTTKEIMHIIRCEPVYINTMQRMLSDDVIEVRNNNKPKTNKHPKRYVPDRIAFVTESIFRTVFYLSRMLMRAYKMQH